MNCSTMLRSSTSYLQRGRVALFLLIGALGFGTATTAQEPTRLDPRQQQHDFVPGVVLLKLKAEVQAQPKVERGMGKLSVSTVDALLAKYQVTQTEKLFKDAAPVTEKRVLRSFSGHAFEQPSLHNIYKIQIGEEAKLFEAIEELKQDPNVVYAEPNYIYATVSDSIPNDSLYSQQWHLPAVQASAVWSMTTGDTTQIIGILDTGVDWQHPDLASKIWINHAELNGTSGFDDDGNSFVDDIRGWDFINSDNNPVDDNSHGTHVAGIAAAASNNGIGIAGVNWHAKIMPIKVFQSSGRGDAATITQGILYATNKGATVLNMSFGSYARSLTMEDALAYAYAQAVLVAAAGNDAICIGPGTGCAPFFPAALSYVLGVQATAPNGDLAAFSNRDPDGPIFSGYPDLLNYELRAPGDGIISTIPNAKYRTYSGTSMAAPVVAGAVSLYRTLFPEHSQEMMWGNLINTSSQHLSLFDALNVQAQPRLSFISQTVVDTLDGDRDGRIDAGETIELWDMVRNTWGQADSVFVGVRFGEFEDTTTAQIIKPTSFVGSISSYARRSNEHDAILIHFSPNIANARDVVFEKLLWSSASPDTIVEQMIVTVENGTELFGILDSTLVIGPDRLWLVLQSFRVGNTGKLIIRPGTNLQIGGGQLINLRGNIIAKGTPDSVITFTSVNGIGAGFWRSFTPAVPNTFQYCQFVNLGNALGDGEVAPGSFIVDHCLFEDITFSIPANTLLLISGIKELTNSVIRNIAPNNVPFGTKGLVRMEKNTFYKIHSFYSFWSNLDNAIVKNNNFVEITSETNSPNPIYDGVFHLTGTNSNIQNNNIISNRHFIASVGTQDQILLPNQYWGRSAGGHLAQAWDFNDDANLPLFAVNPVLSQPSADAPAVVWKVLVNGRDSQEQTLDPLGLGNQRIQIYFNRPMNTSIQPHVTYGVRAPYTQNFVQDSTSWSPDSTMWSAIFQVRISTGDGINQIRVARAQDFEAFEIPVEETRSKFLIDVAGSASTGFVAIAGPGNVGLEWHAPEISDVLGFNMYRYTNLTDTTYTEPILINSSLIIDTTYADQSVTGGTRYYYFYRIVTTSLSESEPSRIVSVVPLAVGVTDEISTTPKEYALIQNFPNPFNPATTIRYDLPRASRVVLKVFNIFGQEIATLVDELKQPGRHSVHWNAANLASGVYFYRLRARDFIATKKLVLLR